MRFRKIVIFQFRTFMRESLLVFLLVGLLFYSFINNEGLEEFLISEELFQFYSLFTMMLVGYAVVISVSFAGLLKRKTSKFYHLYLIFPEKPSRLLFAEIMPTFVVALTSAWGIGFILYSKAPSPSPSWMLIPVFGSALFVWGLGSLSLALTLQVSNVRGLNAVLFLLLFVLARVPRYVVENGAPLKMATALLIAVSVFFAVTGSVTLEKVDPERVILSS
ncbi:MAG: hypothetical protein PWP39_146 [Pyrococcus sp.]|uniref:hypothetical protein n=1 Tax=Pyrococcus sp. TaxID=33866 RepID=UPI00258EA3C1|nr:hypothetical protein [Pyrococcus sp.]MDK2868911.1 hypothetical protein [Pyrococcus sp.]